MGLNIIGVTTVGTYPTHVDFTVGSMYHLVDSIVVVNSGYDVDHPELGTGIPLEREKRLLKEIDVDKKIKQLKGNWQGVKNISLGRSEGGRDLSMSLATQAAFKLGADFVIKIDSDEILHHNVTREKLEELIRLSDNGRIGYRFGMWELQGDFYHYGNLPDWAPEDNHRFPSSNDAPQFYKPRATDWYIGGSPVVTAHIVPFQELFSYHVRSVPPMGVDPAEYFYKRYWYHECKPYEADAVRRGVSFEIDMEEFSKKIKSRAESAVRELQYLDRLNVIDPNAKDPRIPKEVPMIIRMGVREYIRYMKER